MVDKLKLFICDFLNIDPETITKETNLKTDMQLDSLTLIGLIVAIENEFNIELDENDIKNLDTVEDLIAYAEKKFKLNI